MKIILVFVLGLLAHFTILLNADECAGEHNKNDKASKPLHHIIEFGKRSKVEMKGCVKKNSTAPSSKTAGTVLGLHGLFHARSKKKTKLNVTMEKNKVSLLKTITLEKTKNEAGSKRTSGDLHRLQLRTETISMLHKIVEKYFPGGHLTVDQKIKALKILGKLIKLKKEGKVSDIKKLLGALSIHGKNDASTKSTSQDTSNGVKVKEEKSTFHRKDDSGKGEEGGGDIYGDIANGPDVPKLPPGISGKDPDHAHSNIMPVGLQRMRGAGEMVNTLTHQHDLSDGVRDLPNDRITNYHAPFGDDRERMGYGQIYETDNSLVGNDMGLSSMPGMMDNQGYARSRMPYPRRRYSDRRQYYDDDDDDDEDDDDGDYDDDEEEQERTRSYVNRHRFYDDEDDDDDDDVTTYSRRFDRKNKIASTPKKSMSKIDTTNKKS